MVIFILQLLPRGKVRPLAQTLMTAAARDVTSDCFWLSSVQFRFDGSQISRKRVGAKRNIALGTIMSDSEFLKLAHPVAAESE
jgi:hypothetical protein